MEGSGPELGLDGAPRGVAQSRRSVRSSGVRPFRREDLPAVASMYDRVVLGGSGTPPVHLRDSFERALLDHPWADPGLPSLVYEDANGQIAGFQAAYPRRMMLDERPVRMVSCGQLVADPEATTVGIGGLLMRRMLAGGQELTTTDGASRKVQSMWNRLGGCTGGLTCLGWTRVLDPARLAVHVARRRAGKSRTPSGSGHQPASTERHELTPERLIELTDRSRARLRPAYDVGFLEWLFTEMEAVEGRGPLLRRVVHDDRGEPMGWYVGYMPPRSVTQVIGVHSLRPDAGPVLDRLFSDARAAGAIAVQGRVEPAILPALMTRQSLFRRTEWALVHYADDQVAAAAGREQAALTRLDGEWWMGFHLMGSAPPVFA